MTLSNPRILTLGHRWMTVMFLLCWQTFILLLFTNKVNLSGLAIGSYHWAIIGSLILTDVEKTLDVVAGPLLDHWHVFAFLANLYTAPIYQQSHLKWANHRVWSLSHHRITNINRRRKNVGCHRWAIVGSLAFSRLLINLHTVPCTVPISKQR